MVPLSLGYAPSFFNITPMHAIFIEDSFDSAHWLPNVPAGHKCGTMHGHTYRVRIEVTGSVDEHTGWVSGCDYADLKTAWCSIKAELDHRCLNDVIPNPTCENIAERIALMLHPQPSRIELRETANCGVVWTR